VNKAYPLLFAALFSTAATAAGGTTQNTTRDSEGYELNLYNADLTELNYQYIEAHRIPTSLAGAAPAMTVYIAPEPKIRHTKVASSVSKFDKKE
jgi:hypothetical protein